MLRMSSSVARSLLNHCSPRPLPYSTGLPLALRYTTLHKQCSSPTGYCTAFYLVCQSKLWPLFNSLSSRPDCLQRLLLSLAVCLPPSLSLFSPFSLFSPPLSPPSLCSSQCVYPTCPLCPAEKWVFLMAFGHFQSLSTSLSLYMSLSFSLSLSYSCVLKDLQGKMLNFMCEFLLF